VTHVRRSTRKTPNKYRRRSTVSRSSCSEEEPLVLKENKVSFVYRNVLCHNYLLSRLLIMCYFQALQNTNLIFFDSPAEKTQQSTSSSVEQPSGYDFSQFVIPPSPSKTGCLQPMKCTLMSEDSLGHSSSSDTPSS